MSEESAALRRGAAFHELERFAAENNIDLDECDLREVFESGAIHLTYTTPDGQEFGIGYRA